MTLLLDCPFAHDFGMTLVHSLWQILLVAVLFAVVDRLLTRRSADLRYVLAYVALVLMLVLPLTTLFVVSGDSESLSARGIASPQRGDRHPIAEMADSNELSDTPVPTLLVENGTGRESNAVSPQLEQEGVSAEEAGSSVTARSAGEWRWLLPWLAVAWSLGVMAFSLRPFLAVHRCWQLRKTASPIAVPWIADALKTLCTRIGLHRNVEIASSTLVHIPAVLGFARPIILLPIAMGFRADSGRTLRHHCARIGSCPPP